MIKIEKVLAVPAKGGFSTTISWRSTPVTREMGSLIEVIP